MLTGVLGPGSVCTHAKAPGQLSSGELSSSLLRDQVCAARLSRRAGLRSSFPARASYGPGFQLSVERLGGPNSKQASPDEKTCFKGGRGYILTPDVWPFHVCESLHKCIKWYMCDFNFPVIFISLRKRCPSVEHLLSLLRYLTTGFVCGDGV